MNRGLAYVAEGRTREAFAVAKKLHSMRYSGAYEIEAQAFAHDGSKEDAVDVLRKGLEVAPASWLNANLLGNYLSDLGRYDEAFAAYDDALRAPTADATLIESNYAMALQRAGREVDARAKLGRVMRRGLSATEPGLQEFVRSLAIDLKV